MLAAVWSVDARNEEVVKLSFNDIDVYHGNFGEGNIERRDCTYSKLEDIEKDVNFIKCNNLNLLSLVRNCDINAVAVFVEVKVENKKVSCAD